MSLCFAGVVPHSPLLIPSIGKEKTAELQKTVDALKQLEQDLYLAKADVVLLFTPHGSLFDDSFAVNAHTHYVSGFDEFGDFETKREWKGIPDLAANISHESHLKNIAVRLVSNEKLDHGSSVPLYYLTEHLPDVKILPAGFSGLSREDHLAYGELLKDIVMEQDKRVAIIASGDLSHKLSPDSPGGFNPNAKVFDKTLTQLLEAGNLPSIIAMDPAIVDGADACAYRTILMLLGVLQHMHFSFKTYAYEAPYGVGYLTGNFSF